MKCCNGLLAFLMLVVLVPQQSMAKSQMWGNDVLVHQANHVYGFGIDQADKDTLLLVVSDSSTTDSRDTLYIYRSTDDGVTWSYVTSLFSEADNWHFGKADIIAAKLNHPYVLVFWIYNKELWYAKYPYDFGSAPILGKISDVGENIVDFDVCQNLYVNYWLFLVYQTDMDSVVFKRSTDRGSTWSNETNLTSISPISTQPRIAWNRGYYLVIVGKTPDDRIYAIRTTASPPSWTDGIYLSGSDACTHPAVAASHTTPSADAYFWIFYQRWDGGANPPRWMLDYHYGQGGTNWSSVATLSDSSTCPSLHVLKEEDISDITLAYRHGDQIRYIYGENQQTTPDLWPIPSSGVSTYDIDTLPPQRAYTIRGTDNTVMAAVLYVSFPGEDLYFNASSFTGVDDEIGDQPVSGFTLNQNYPNPFNPYTTIEYALEKDGEIEVAVHNILGQKVKTLFGGYKSSGKHRITWDGTDNSSIPVASGVYFYKIKSNDQMLAKKMVLAK